MPPAAPQEQARALALRSLAAQARTEAQLRRRLDRAGLGAEADEVVAWLGRLGYLDDAAWARARARALLRPGRLGPRQAERRLLGAGIPPALAREAVEGALAAEGEATGGPAGGGELALCAALLARRARGASPAELDERARARLWRFLLGRGFAPEVVGQAMGGRAPGDG